MEIYDTSLSKNRLVVIDKNSIKTHKIKIKNAQQYLSISDNYHDNIITHDCTQNLLLMTYNFILLIIHANVKLLLSY